ncbi:10416_t:CDS:2 [Paraglomus brasilianum]|uniref:10416_t:CDS:1 n=1 Tax=Paraglomus brasilianum TaxID=144538 RepID=A0A9N9F106_9GLOM|nr:10416_t:CDS:2 [Paraglomus brasilianum]
MEAGSADVKAPDGLSLESLPMAGAKYRKIQGLSCQTNRLH